MHHYTLVSEKLGPPKLPGFFHFPHAPEIFWYGLLPFFPFLMGGILPFCAEIASAAFAGPLNMSKLGNGWVQNMSIWAELAPSSIHLLSTSIKCTPPPIWPNLPDLMDFWHVIEIGLESLSWSANTLDRWPLSENVPSHPLHPLLVSYIINLTLQELAGVANVNS